jgi:hypothetical protein
MKRLRWRIIKWLNRRRDFCWFELVCWDTFERSWRDLWDMRPGYWLRGGTEGCVTDAVRDGECCCGKFKRESLTENDLRQEKVYVSFESEDRP